MKYLVLILVAFAQAYSQCVFAQGHLEYPTAPETLDVSPFQTPDGPMPPASDHNLPHAALADEGRFPSAPQSLLPLAAAETCPTSPLAGVPIDANWGTAMSLPSVPEAMLVAPARLGLYSQSERSRDRLVNQDIPARAATLAYGPLELVVQIPLIADLELDAIRVWLDGKQTHPSQLRPLQRELGMLDGIPTLDLHYQWNCPPLGRHGIQVTYLRGDRWSVISQPLRFEIMEPTAPVIIAIGIDEQAPRPVGRRHATPVSGTVKLKLAGPHPGDTVAIEIDGRQVTTATVDAECCVTAHLHKQFSTGRYQLAVRSVSGFGCGLTSTPSQPHWIDLYDHDSQISRTDLIAAAPLTFEISEPIVPPTLPFLPVDYAPRLRMFQPEKRKGPFDTPFLMLSEFLHAPLDQFENTITDVPPNRAIGQPAGPAQDDQVETIAADTIGSNGDGQQEASDLIVLDETPRPACQTCGAACPIDCTACLQCELWKTKAAEPGYTLSDNADDLRQRAAVVKARVESLAAQLDRLVEHAKALNRENTSLRDKLIGHIKEIEGAVGEQLKLYLLIQTRQAQIKRKRLRLHNLQFDLLDPEMEFNVHEAERDPLAQFEVVSNLDGKLQPEVKLYLDQNFNSVENVLQECPLQTLDCQPIEPPSKQLDTYASPRQIQPQAAAQAMQSVAQHTGVDFSPAVELLLQDAAFADLKPRRDQLGNHRQCLDASLQKHEREVDLLLAQLATQQLNAIADVMDIERVIHHAHAEAPLVAGLTAVFKDADAAWVVAQQKLKANNDDTKNATLSNQLSTAADKRMHAAAELAKAKERQTPQITDITHLKQQTQFLLNAQTELKRLLNGLADCIASETERQRRMSRLELQLLPIANNVQAQIAHLEAHRDFLDIVITNADTAIQRRETLATDTGRALYRERMHAQAQRDELAQRLRYQQDTLNAQLAAEQARAKAAESLAQLHWQQVQARDQAEHALRKFAPPTVTYFHAPAHFPIPRFGKQGADDARDGMVIAEGMKLVSKADGSYDVEYKVLRSALPATLALQIHFKTSSDAPWETITLKPQQIRPGSQHMEYADDSNELLENLSELRFVTFTDRGTHPALRQRGGQVVRVRRTGTARFGYGFQGLDVYGRVASGSY